MDRIKELILERVQHSHLLKAKCEDTIDTLVLYQAKKAEKLRQIKENELIEALFNFGQASKSERQAFEVHSSEVMSSLNYQFNYKPKSRGLFSDIAEMYILFFDSIKLEARVEEIRIIAKYNLYQNFPFLCMLFKWLIEISRKLFVDVMTIAKTKAQSDKQKKPQYQSYSPIRNGNNLVSSQERLKSTAIPNSKNICNLTATTASQNTQESFNKLNGDQFISNQNKYIKLNPIKSDSDKNKKNSSDDIIFMKKRSKQAYKGAYQNFNYRQNKENSREGSKQNNSNIINLNHTVMGITSSPQRDNQLQQQQQQQDPNVLGKHTSLMDKYCSTQPHQSEFSPKLSASYIQSSSAISNKRRSLRISNSYTHKHSIDESDLQSQIKDFRIMSATQNFDALNLSEIMGNDEEEDEEEEEQDTSMVIIKQTQSQILKCTGSGGKNSINQVGNSAEQDTQPPNQNLVVGSVNNSKIQSIKESNQQSSKQKVANEQMLKNQIKPNAEKLKRRKREQFFNNVKDCINDVEFVVQKCNDYLQNFYIKLIYQRNVQVKNTIDIYRAKYWQKFNNTFAKLDPGLIYTEQDKINAEEQLNILLSDNPLAQSTNSLDIFQKSTSQFLQNRSDQSQLNTSNILNSTSNNMSSSQNNRRTCTTLSPIHRPLGSERKSQKSIVETSKSNNFASLNQNYQANLQLSGDKDRKRMRTYSQIGTLNGQNQTSQQEKSLSPLSQFNQQLSKEFVQQNSVQMQQFQFLPSYLQRNSPEIRRQNIKNNKYMNGIIPAVKNFDTSEIEPNTFNANHILNLKHSNILKGKQSKFQKNLMMMKDKFPNQQNTTQFQQFNLLENMANKKGDEGKHINMIQNNTFYYQNSNILKKIHSNDLTLSNIILNTGNKGQQQNGQNSQINNVLDENIGSQPYNHNAQGGGSSCIILQATNNQYPNSNGQENYSKSATKPNYSNSNLESLVYEDEFSRAPQSYHLNRGKYRPPKNPKILLQKIQNGSEEQTQGVVNPQNQQRNLSGGKQTPYSNNLLQNGFIGPFISSFQNDISQVEMQMKINQPRKSHLQNTATDNLIGVTALKNRKVLTQPDEVNQLTPNEKVIPINTFHQQYQCRSASGKGSKDEVVQRLLITQFNGQTKQNQPPNLNLNNNSVYMDIQRQIGIYSVMNGNNTNQNNKSNNQLSYSNPPYSHLPPPYIQHQFNDKAQNINLQINNDNSIFPFLKDAVALQQDNLQKYF